MLNHIKEILNRCTIIRNVQKENGYGDLQKLTFNNVTFISGYPNRLHFISIVTLDYRLTISNFSTTCQLTVIRVLVYYSRLLG